MLKVHGNALISTRPTQGMLSIPPSSRRSSNGIAAYAATAAGRSRSQMQYEWHAQLRTSPSLFSYPTTFSPGLASGPSITLAATGAAATFSSAWTATRLCRRRHVSSTTTIVTAVRSSGSRRQQQQLYCATSFSASGTTTKGSIPSASGKHWCPLILRFQLNRRQLRVLTGVTSMRYGFGAQVGEGNVAAARHVLVACVPSGSASRGNPRGSKGGRRSSKSDAAGPAPSAPASGSGSGGGTSITSGTAASAASSPVPAPSPSACSSPSAVASSGKGVSTAATRRPTSARASAAVAVLTQSLDGGESDYEVATVGAVGGNIVPFARRQPRALVLDCAYRPINVLTWYKAFHFDYFGKGEVLEYYPPPAVCTTGSGDHLLPAVLRVPQYTADMQDLCSRVACTRRNIMVRDGFCCQYCGGRRDLTLDHVHPVSKGGKETWENLVTACMRCNQKKSDRTLRELGWKLRRQPKEPTPYEIGIVAGISTSDILRPPPEWEAYIAPYKERLEMYRRAAVEAGLVNLIDEDR